ncbi:hypothetical protein E2C01_044025 [Portunus trituberculatus]|uniref:Uncharacterized protein n=1 Tax=Portunus trituberculatus TaxID=210409 RepID=A0A5B7FUG9_PORTR|nr:hypothetical protein [Portunus trituberculatus]
MPRALTPTSTSNSGSGCGPFYREELQTPPQPARSALDRDTGIPEGKRQCLSKKRQKGRQRQQKQKGTELWIESPPSGESTHHLTSDDRSMQTSRDCPNASYFTLAISSTFV